MRKEINRALAVLLGVFALLPRLGSTNQHCDHFPHKEENLFIPDFSVQLTSKPYWDHLAFSGLLEAGRRNGRANGTLGFSTSRRDFFKLSGEFLIQDIKYHFSSGGMRRWMHQYAGGVGYQRALGVCWLPSFELTGYLSHAPSRTPTTRRCGDCFVYRHLAGANAQGAATGLTFAPWCSATLQIAGNYDHVSYRRKHGSHLSASGFGATAHYNQQLFCNWDLDLEGGIRQPFNFWRGALNWHPKKMADQMTVGLFASRTVGMSHLPNNTTAGIQLSYAFGPNCTYSRMKSCSSKPKVEKDATVKGENKPKSAKESKDCCHVPCLVSWTSTPAVLLPTVLAVADQKKVCRRPVPPPPCIPPTTTGIPDFPNTGAAAWTYDVSPFFSGSPPLTFSIDPVSQALLEGFWAGTFSPDGVFSGQPNEATAPMDVTVQNACGQVTTSFQLGS